MFVHQQVFCTEAYLAQTDKDLTNAIADFMDCSIVIPPTEIQDKGMLEPIIEFQQRMLRDRLRPCDSRLAFGDRLKGSDSVKVDQIDLELYKNSIKVRFVFFPS